MRGSFEARFGSDTGAHVVEFPIRLFDGDLSEVDKVAYINHIAGKLMEQDVLVKQDAENSKSQFGLSDFKGILMDTVIAGLDNYKSMAAQVLGNDRKKQEFADLVLDVVYEGLQNRVYQKSQISNALI